jgi:hypothetical protein
VRAPAGQLDDDVWVHAKLNAPAYCYLIAFNPDGKEQLCYPEDRRKRPARSDEIEYPQDIGEGFPLTDGVGLQAFVLVASHDPLPAYESWRRSLGELPWRSFQAEGVWRSDGNGVGPLVPEERGAPRKLGGAPREFEALCKALKHTPSIDTLRAVAFPVKEARK